MMSGPHPLHAGDGYEYLTRQVASADRERDRARDLTDYYTEHGTPPGQWFGKGAAALEMSGEVTERQMQALFGEGLHPDADRIIATALDEGVSAEEAVRRAKLGAMYSEFTSKKTAISEIYDRRLDEWIEKNQARPGHDVRMVLRTDAAREFLRTSLGRKPTTEEINNALAMEKKQSQRAVAGFDCVFTPPKSWSVLWGLADDDLRRELYQIHIDSVRITLGWAEEHFALARRGKGGQFQIDADGLTIATFEHYDNRTGDPNPHTHCVISTKVSADMLDARGEPVLDEKGRPKKKWTSLDARAFFGGATSMSCMYNAVSMDLAKRRIGFEFVAEDRGRGKEPVMEIADVPRALRDKFSRRPDIIRRTEELAADYRQRHGRDPSKRIQHKLAQQATLDTRDAKPVPKSLREMITEWNERAQTLLGGLTGAQFAAQILRWHKDPTSRPFDPERAAVSVGVALGGKLATVSSDPIVRSRAIDAELAKFVWPSPRRHDDAWWKIAQLLDPRAENNALDDIARAQKAAKDRVYDRDVVAREVLEKVSRRRATWNEAHIRAAAFERLQLCDFDSDDGLLNATDEVVRKVRDSHSILMTIDPDEPPKKLQRRNGEAMYNTLHMTTALYTSQAVLDAEDYVREAARTPTAYILTRAAVDEAIAEIELAGRAKHGQDFQLNSGQRNIVRHLCMSGMQHDVAVGPAGAGKTTSMEAVVRAWTKAGLEVIALSPQKSAAEVLAADIGAPAATIDSLLYRMRNNPSATIRPGTMILVDEAAMASTAQLLELQQIATKFGAVVRAVGDPYQLSAVESGGLMRLIAKETRAPVLSTVVRFATEGEDEASLHVRNGDPLAAFDWYTGEGRITSGMTDDLRGQILAEYLADRTAGSRSLMMAATIADVASLNGSAQAALGLAGEVSVKGRSHELSDGHRGHVGDTIVTRKNTNHLRVTGGIRNGSSVDNGNLWKITKVHKDGSLTAIGVGHKGKVNLPADYVKDNVELGYATTVHRAQGMTVDRAYLLMNKSLGRALAYVGLTRGRRWNGLFLATDTLPDPGVEIQPFDEDEEPTQRDLWLRVMAREDDNLTATEMLRAEQKRMSDPKRARLIYDEATGMLAAERAHYLLDRALPTVYWREVSASAHLQSLIDTIAVADHHRLDTEALVTSIATNDDRDLGESLAEARDLTAVLRARADAWIRDHLDPTTCTVTADVESLAETPLTDHDALFDNILATNTGAEVMATSERGARFYAVRDAEFVGVPPVPPRHAGTDAELADFAQQLRARLVGGVDEPPAATPSQRAEEIENYDQTVDPELRRARIRRDYEAYVRDLSRDRARYLLDRALPIAISQTVERSRGHSDLLDTISLADAFRLDSEAMVADITSNGGRDDGESILAARDAAGLLRFRADAWIRTNLVTTAVDMPATATLALEPGVEIAALTASAAATNLGADVLSIVPPSGKFRALTDLGLPRGLRPIPPEHPGMDTAVADHADELRRRLLDLPEDAPDWRTRAVRHDYADDDNEPGFDEWDAFAAATTTDLPYPELDAGERVTRLRTELAAARAQAELLAATIMSGESPHALAIEPILELARTRRDALSTLLIDAREAREMWQDADRAAVDAEEQLRDVLDTDEDGSGRADLAWMQDIVDSTTDPTVRAQLGAKLDEYRTALDATAAARRDAARAHAESTRAWAEQVHTDLETAEAALARAAQNTSTSGTDDQHEVIDARDIEYLRNYADTLALADLAAARAQESRLAAQLMRARSAAIEDRANDLGISRGQAAVDIDTEFQPTGEQVDAALVGVLGRSAPAHTAASDQPNAAMLDTAVRAARRSIGDLVAAVDNGLTPPPIGDEPIAVMIRTQADQLMPWAIAARSAALDAARAENAAQGLEGDLQRLVQRQEASDPWAGEEPFVTALVAQIDSLDENSPQRATLMAMLDEYRATAADSAALDARAKLVAAEHAATTARADAERLRAAADTAGAAYQARRRGDQRPDEPEQSAPVDEPTTGASPVATRTRTPVDPAIAEPIVTAETPLNEAAADYLQTLAQHGKPAPDNRDRHAPRWLPGPPLPEDTAPAAAVARDQYAAITARTMSLGDAAADDQPDWTAHLGPIPRGAAAQANWVDLAGQVAAWREQHSITEHTSALGPRPDDPNHALAWDELTTQVDQQRRRTAEAAPDRGRIERERRDREANRTRPITPDAPDRDRGIDI
ncbi:MobF family relaxase [Nocardia neocaledoniensis]|uniref:MobF family relaxase n=1 Tax=Nocardia neocaledoniensis TaxID=236511 RepID=UPI00313D4861